MADRIAWWALCVEFVHDLRRLPMDEWLTPLKSLARPAVAACQKLASHLRARHPVLYVRVADDNEARLETEVKGATATDLGKIDTFRFEDRTVLGAALDALGGGRFDDAYGYATARTAADSFWPQVVRGRQVAWNLVKLAAQLGRAVDPTRPLGGARSLAEAIDWYVATGHEVDAAHRQLEQARHQLAHFEIEEVGVLRERLDQLRGVYRNWADRVAHAFNDVCRAEGFLPAPALQQRTLFDDVVAPAAAEELTAYFLVDALRFEMGAQLAASLGESKTADVVLKVRLAELPSVTEVTLSSSRRHTAARLWPPARRPRIRREATRVSKTLTSTMLERCSTERSKVALWMTLTIAGDSKIRASGSRSISARGSITAL